MATAPGKRLNWDGFHSRAIAPAGAKAAQWRDWVKANDPVYNSFRRPGRPEKIAGGLLLLLIAAVVVFLLLFDWNWLRGPIGRWASAKYDREIALQGDLDVKLFSWTPSVVVRDLKFGGPGLGAREGHRRHRPDPGLGAAYQAVRRPRSRCRCWPSPGPRSP